MLRHSFLSTAKKLSPFEIDAYADHVKELERTAPPVTYTPLGMKVVVISDTHGHLAFGDHRLECFLDRVGEFDLCLLLGDIEPEEMGSICDCIPREKILGVLGNHDVPTLYKSFRIKDISGKAVRYKGLTIGGIGGSFRYKDADFPSLTNYQSLVLAEKMPSADILITHDTAFTYPYRDPAHSGLAGISHCIFKKGARFHFHGHIHSSYEKRYSNGTVEKCVYLAEGIEI